MITSLKQRDVIQSPLLAQQDRILHFTTTRNGTPAQVPENIYVPNQTHSSHIAIVTAETDAATLEDTDALITNLPGICIAVKTADCVPVLLYDSVRQAVAAIHAGWKGTAQQIVVKTVEKMADAFDSDPQDILAFIGPAISMDAYEVGEEVSSVFQDMKSVPETAIKRYPSGKNHINLPFINSCQLIGAGLSANNIDISDLCTYSHPELFFSARRDGMGTGRMLSGISLRKEGDL